MYRVLNAFSLMNAVLSKEFDPSNVIPFTDRTSIQLLFHVWHCSSLPSGDTEKGTSTCGTVLSPLAPGSTTMRMPNSLEGSRVARAFFRFHRRRARPSLLRSQKGRPTCEESIPLDDNTAFRLPETAINHHLKDNTDMDYLYDKDQAIAHRGHPLWRQILSTVACLIRTAGWPVDTHHDGEVWISIVMDFFHDSLPMLMTDHGVETNPTYRNM